MSSPLHLTHPRGLGRDAYGNRQKESVEVGFGLAGDRLRVRFEVKTFEITPNPELETGSPQWGLWDWDVVEVFLSVNGAKGSLPYYEFQVSPLGQYFELKILEPRKQTDREFRSGLKCGARILKDEPGDCHWEGWMEIPLTPLGWDGNPANLVGGAFSILGDTSKRYWSLFLPQQETPDFHIPQYFQLLIKPPAA